MKAKKFVTIFGILFVLTTVFVWTGYKAMTKLKRYYLGTEYVQYGINVFERMSEKKDAKAVLIGNSVLLTAFDNKAYPEVANLALGGSSPRIGYFTLKKFLATGARPKVLVLSYTDYWIGDKSGFFNRAVKYDFLTKDEFAEAVQVAKTHKRCGEFAWGGYGCEAGEYERYKENYLTYLNEFFEPFKFPARAKRNKAKLAELRAGYFYYGTQRSNSEISGVEKSEFKFDFRSLNGIFLQMMVELARQNGVEEVLFWAPVRNEASFKEQTKIFPKRIKSYGVFLEQMNQKFGIKPLNQLEARPNNYFGDHNGHFNENGRKAMTKEIYEKLKPFL